MSDSDLSPVVVSIAAPSGSGKTTLIEKLIRELCQLGLRVGAVKSDAHRVELDRPGKDTHRMRQSGAHVTALVSENQIAVFRDVPGPPISLADVVRLFFPNVDLVVAEGFRSRGLPTIVVCRRGVSLEGWAWPANVIAVATDEDVPTESLRLDLNRPDTVAAFLCERFDLQPPDRPG